MRKRLALVTGAMGGIGRAMCQALYKDGSIDVLINNGGIHMA